MTMNRHSSSPIGPILASLVCFGGLLLALWTFWPAPDGAAPAPIIAHADVAALEASTPRATDVGRLLAQPDAPASIERAVSDGLASLGLTLAEERDIARLATDRLRLFVAPSRQGYLEHLETTLGANAASAASDEQIEKYLLYATPFTDAEIDIDSTAARPRYVDGVLVSTPTPGGHTSYNRGHQPYTSISDPEADKADVVDVFVPMIVSSPRDPAENGKVYLILSLIRDPEAGGWRPWRHSVYDPSDRIGVLPSPWM